MSLTAALTIAFVAAIALVSIGVILVNTEPRRVSTESA